MGTALRQPAFAAAVAALGAACVAGPRTASCDVIDEFSTPEAARLSAAAEPEAVGKAIKLSGAAPTTAQARLKMVQVIFRHGARTPLTPNDAYWKGAKWDVCGEAFPKPSGMEVVNGQSGKRIKSVIDRDVTHSGVRYPGGCTKGELTMLGQLQALRLGHHLRKRYVDDIPLLSRVPNYHEVWMHTTNTRRTRLTAHCVLTGLFPVTDGGAWTVTTNPEHEEVLTVNVASCDQLAAWYQAARRDRDEQNKMDEELAAVDKSIRGAMGLPIEGDQHRIHSWSELNDSLTCLRAHGKAIPPGLTQDDLAEINRQATARVRYGLFTSASTRHVLRLGMGRLLAHIEDLFEAAAAGDAAAVRGEAGQRLMGNRSGQPLPKVVLWSAHDVTIMPLLRMLEQDVSDWPPYASSVVLELWQDTSPAAAEAPTGAQHYVRLFHDERELFLPEWPPGEPLSLAEFRTRVLDRYAVQDAQYELECAMPGKLVQAGPEGAASVDSTSY